MNVWRVTRGAYCRSPADAFGGKGAAEAGGRWNSGGIAVAYSSQTWSLAILEYLANLADRALAPTDLVGVRATLPDSAVGDITKRVPNDWRAVPAPASPRAFGDRFIAEGRWLAALVPSVTLPDPSWAYERNVLVNPSHGRFMDVTYGGPWPFSLDARLR